MANPRLQTRVNQATKQRVERYQEQAGEPTQSDAVRRLIVRGLEAEGGVSPNLVGYLWSIAPVATLTLIVAAGLFHFTPYLDSPGFIGFLVVVTFVANVIPLWSSRSSGGDS